MAGKIIGIQCVDSNGFYAEEGETKLPWPNSHGDLDWFKYITKGGIVVVGSKTFNRLPPLTDREVWGVGKDCFLKSREDVVKKYSKDRLNRDLFVGGGNQLWDSFSNLYDYFYLTVLKSKYVTKNGLRSKIFDENYFEDNLIIEKPNYKVFKINNPIS